MNTSDKRRARRFPMNLPAMIKGEEIEEDPQENKTCNVSSRGVYLECASPLDVGMTLEFVLTLPVRGTKGRPVRIKCVGQVVRVDQAESEGKPLGVAATIERYEFLREA